MPVLENELARRTNGQLELRSDPLRLTWNFSDTVTSDGHDIRCTFECSVRALPDPAERRMLQEVLLHGREEVTSDAAAAHFYKSLRSSLRGVVEQSPTVHVLSNAGRTQILDALKSAARSIAFATGLELLPPFHIDVESPGYQQERLRAMQRTTAERNAAGQVEHFARSAELLQQFNTLLASAPQLSAGQVLEQVSPADRGSVLQSLLHASAKQQQAAALWAVSGSSLVRVNSSSAKNPEVFPLPSILGPLRSVQPATIDGRTRLLVGAQSGFIRTQPDTPSEGEIYSDRQINSQLGFSRVIFWNDANGYVACHGEAGIVIWSPGDPSQPSRRVDLDELRRRFPAASTTATPRNVEVISDDRIVFSYGNVLAVMRDDDESLIAVPTSSQAEIVAIVPDDRRIIVVHEDGVVCGVDPSTLEITCQQRTGSRIRAAGALPWLGSIRLLLAGDDGAIQCMGLDDPLVTRYASSHHAPRVVGGSTDLVVAVSADRQRLILWNIWDGRQPVTEIHLTGLTRHRTAGIAFG